MRALLLLLLAIPGGMPDRIDRRVADRWAAEGLSPAPIADDYEFLRRLSLDLRGLIPEPAEIRAFAADRDPAKREKIVDAWLRSAAFARHWASRWAEDLTTHPALVQKFRDAHEGFTGWLRDAVRSNMAFDRFARRILTAKGPTDLDPAAGFLVLGLVGGDEAAKDVAERAARIFLGTQVRCAECHDHPFDDWTQQDFFGLASFFWQSRQGGKRTGDGGPVVAWISDDPALGDARFGDAKKASSVAPRWKAGGGTPAEGEPRRAAFARLLTADRQFARAGANRHWGMLVGRGLVHPLDGFTATRKASHPELLEELADGFARSGFDVRALMRSILLSKPYQLSSRGGGGGDALFARALTAPMPPQHLFDCIVQATGIDEKPWRPKNKSDPSGPRDAFLREFRPSFLVNDAAPSGGGAATIAQALYLLNNEVPARATSADPNLRLGRILAQERDPAKRIEELFLCTLSRPPTAREAGTLLERVRKSGDRAEAYEDVFWALLNSTEFVTRH